MLNPVGMVTSQAGVSTPVWNGCAAEEPRGGDTWIILNYEF